MEEFARVLGSFICVAMIVYWLSRYRRENVDEIDHETLDSNETKPETLPLTNTTMNNEIVTKMRRLLEQTLKNIGCHINMCEDDEDRFFITYQGEHFTIVYSESSQFINIYDVAWYSAELDDIDNLSIVRQAVNACNQENHSMVLYTIDKENNCVNVHTRQCIVFGSYIPEVEDYLRSRFEDSFRQHHNFYKNMEKIRQKQCVY